MVRVGRPYENRESTLVKAGKERAMSKMIALLSMIATLAIAYGLDRWEILLKKLASAELDISEASGGSSLPTSLSLPYGLTWPGWCLVDHRKACG